MRKHRPEIVVLLVGGGPEESSLRSLANSSWVMASSAAFLPQLPALCDSYYASARSSAWLGIGAGALNDD
ncbi:MAG: hypothetical protein ACJ8AH_26770 [Stellaceae bacterium]